MTIKKILILAANPLDTDRLRLDKEVEEIRTTLERSPNRDNFAIESRGAVTPQDLQTYLFNLNPYILHFSGHGGGDLGLFFEDEDGKAIAVRTGGSNRKLVVVDEESDAIAVRKVGLEDFFKLFANQIQCVVLNACYSEVQATAIAKHIPYVIGMNQAIGDKAARNFSEGFYKAIWADRSIEDAFVSGVTAIALESIPEELTPVLLKHDRSLPKLNRNTDISVVENNGYFYIVRSRLEQRCYEEVVKAGSLIRIKSPQGMGKSFLMGRVLEYVTQKGYRTVVIDLCEASQQTFGDINRFLQWFCAYVGYQLGIENHPKDDWKGFLGANTNCTKYVEKFFLNSAISPLVIAIDNFDFVFKYPDLEADFCGLLRGWFERANTSRGWGKLRQIIVYSHESDTTHNINQSPFNIGVPIELGELNLSELVVLVNAYGLSWTNAEIAKLIDMIGGHPYLVQKAIDQIAHQYIELDELLRTASTEEGIYREHLTLRLRQLEDHPDLVNAMIKVVNSEASIRLGTQECRKLDSLGLIKRQSNDIVPRCNLYRLYFRDRLN